MGELEGSQDYVNFRAWVPFRHIRVGRKAYESWMYYDWGRRAYPEPLVCVHDLCGDADAFFHQMLYLVPRGYRVISVCLPNVERFEDLTTSLDAFLREIGTKRVHLYGAGLGALVCLAFATKHSERVCTLALTHALLNLKWFSTRMHLVRPLVRLMPFFMLESTFLNLCPRGNVEIPQALATEFLTRRALARGRECIISRLLLCATDDKINTWIRIPDEYITLLDVVGNCSARILANKAMVHRRFQGAKLADLKEGGEFPYVASPDAVNVHLLVHMRRHAKAPLEPLPIPLPAKALVDDPVEARRRREAERFRGRQSEIGNQDKSGRVLIRKRCDPGPTDGHDRVVKYQQNVAKLHENVPSAPPAQLAPTLNTSGGDAVPERFPKALEAEDTELILGSSSATFDVAFISNDAAGAEVDTNSMVTAVREEAQASSQAQSEDAEAARHWEDDGCPSTTVVIREDELHGRVAVATEVDENVREGDTGNGAPTGKDLALRRTNFRLAATWEEVNAPAQQGMDEESLPVTEGERGAWTISASNRASESLERRATWLVAEDQDFAWNGSQLQQASASQIPLPMAEEEVHFWTGADQDPEALRTKDDTKRDSYDLDEMRLLLKRFEERGQDLENKNSQQMLHLDSPSVEDDFRETDAALSHLPAWATDEPACETEETAEMEHENESHTQGGA